MATRIYLDRVADTVPISPSPDGDWDETTLLARVSCGPTKSGEALDDVTFTGSSSPNRDILFRQYISLPLVAGQTITGGQDIEFTCRATDVPNDGNCFLALGMRVMAGDGTTVRKTLLAVAFDDTAITNAGESRDYSVSSVAGNYTTVANDRLVIEVGISFLT